MHYFDSVSSLRHQRQVGEGPSHIVCQLFRSSESEPNSKGWKYQLCPVAQAFFAEIYQEAKRATPGDGHRALAAIERSGKLQRHYTLNVDGLAAAVGLSTWHPTNNPQGGACLDSQD